MPTKRFQWKNRDTAARDLLQIVYHAPPFISRDALRLLSAIRANVIVPDLKKIVLDSNRDQWDSIFALRSIRSISEDIYFPELARCVRQAFKTRQKFVVQWRSQTDQGDDVHFPYDIVEDAINFVACHPSNQGWLFECFDLASPRVLRGVLVKQLFYSSSGSMQKILLHRLIVLLQAYPELLSLRAVQAIYDSKQDTIAQVFLEKQLDQIIELALDAKPSKRHHYDFVASMSWKWDKLQSALAARRPEYEEYFKQHEMDIASQHAKWQAIWNEDTSYTNTTAWREIESLFMQASNGEDKAFWRLYHQIFDRDLSIPIRSASMHFFGKLRNDPRVIDKLIFFAANADDQWNDLHPIRFEAAKALFDIGTNQAWMGLIEAFFTARNNFLTDRLFDWIECLTDMLSGVTTTFEFDTTRIENQWFRDIT